MIFQTDKMLHSLMCFYLYVSIYSLIRLVFRNRIFAHLVTFTIVSAVAIGKEIYDSFQPYNKFDYKDLVADYIGITNAICVTELYELQ